MGYQMLVPYRGNSLIPRIFREVWFRLRLPGRTLWYNKKIRDVDADAFIIRDSLITVDFLKWLRKFFPETRMILDYDNIGSTTLDPESIQDSSIEKWSYDVDDCMKYGMKLKPMAFLDVYRISEKSEPIYDVLYLGRDKGRLDNLLELEEELTQMGLRTYFHICADRRFQTFSNKHYKRIMSYDDYMKLMKKSKAILNYVSRPQASMTMRDMEVVFNGIKGITNNVLAKQFPLYDPSRFFILGEDPIGNLKEFLNTPFRKIEESELEPYKYGNAVDEMLRG